MGRTSRATSTSCAPRRRVRLPPCRNRSRSLRRRRRAHPHGRRELATSSVRALETRNSHGLDQFCASLEERPGLHILDLAGASQATISFVTNYGHRLYSDDFVHQLDQCFGEGDFYENQANPLKAGKFLDSTLAFPEEHFDGALAWDTLQFLSAPLLSTVMGRLHRALKPGACLLAFFHAE